MEQKLNQHGIGILAATGSYILWGTLPLYWKLVSHVPADIVLAHRIIWSLVFMLGMLLILGKLMTFLHEVKKLFTNKRQFLFITLAACFISLNWFSYIWAVNHDILIEASLGYYINPLMSVVFGMFFFKEKLTKWQTISLLLATVGVAIKAVYTGGVPLISITLAITFALYSVLKKKVEVGVLTGLAIETMLVTPIAILYLSFAYPTISEALYLQSLSTFAFLACAGGVTAAPLLLFATSTKRIPLSMIGFIQYLSPTIMLLIGNFIYGEAFDKIHLFAFSFIWLALIIYTVSQSTAVKKRNFDSSQKQNRPAS